MTTTDELLDRLARHFGSGRITDQRGYTHVDCPFPGCDVEAKDRACSYWLKDGYVRAGCFKCGLLTKEFLDLSIGYRSNGSAPIRRARRQKKAPPKPTYYAWKQPGQAEIILRQQLNHPDRVRLWQEYRPFDVADLDRWEHGVGVLPNTACRHLRLTYPVRARGGRIVAFRGRRIDCDCRGKWLTCGGGKVQKTLMICGPLEPGRVVVIAESPIDARLAYKFEPEYTYVASGGGAGLWNDDWTRRIAASSPAKVIVWFDNDLAGQAVGDTRDRLAREWWLKHPNAPRGPIANGIRLFNRLRFKLPVELYDWGDAPPKSDISSLIIRRMK
jgi:hypothetical protein